MNIIIVQPFKITNIQNSIYGKPAEGFSPAGNYAVYMVKEVPGKFSRRDVFFAVRDDEGHIRWISENKCQLVDLI